jgi:hypothetical protein
MINKVIKNCSKEFKIKTVKLIEEESYSLHPSTD